MYIYIYIYLYIYIYPKLCWNANNCHKIHLSNYACWSLFPRMQTPNLYILRDNMINPIATIFHFSNLILQIQF